MGDPYMAITAVIACRVDCDFCPQELLIKEYQLKNNLNLIFNLLLLIEYRLMDTKISM